MLTYVRVPTHQLSCAADATPLVESILRFLGWEGRTAWLTGYAASEAYYSGHGILAVFLTFLKKNDVNQSLVSLINDNY
jgi:hypothetical protein